MITLTNGQQVEDWRVFFRRRLALGSSWDLSSGASVFNANGDAEVWVNGVKRF